MPISVKVLWINWDGRRMNISCKFPGNATWKDHESIRGKENVTLITKMYFGLLLHKISAEKVRVDSTDVLEFEWVLKNTDDETLEVR